MYILLKHGNCSNGYEEWKVLDTMSPDGNDVINKMPLDNWLQCERCYYQQLNQDVTKICSQKVQLPICSTVTLQTTKNFLIHLIQKQPASKIARFYLLPKIHKPGNPGRPTVASYRTPTENISKFSKMRQFVQGSNNTRGCHASLL